MTKKDPYPVPTHPDPTFGGAYSRTLEGDREAELTRAPVVPAHKVPGEFGADPHKVALGNLAGGILLPTRENVAEVYERPAKRAERVRAASMYAFDDGPSTGRHVREGQPRYTVVGPDAVQQVIAEASAPGYEGRHNHTPNDYVGRHRHGRVAKALGKLRSLMQGDAAAPAAPAAAHRAPIAQLGRGDTLAVGRSEWVPGVGQAELQGSPLSEYYAHTSEHQGEYVVGDDGRLTYYDQGKNASTLFYQESTPREWEVRSRNTEAGRQRAAAFM